MKLYGLRGTLLLAVLFFAIASPVYARGTCNSAKGSPVWSVNKINLNLYVTDIPLWYDPPIGPSVEIRLSYNSQATAEPNAPFGNKWQFNYQSSLTVGTGTATVTMPDGRVDVYTGSGSSYTAPTGVFSTLTNIGGNRYELKFTDGEVYVYDIPPETSLSNPVLVQIRDAYANTLNLHYNASNQLETITDATSQVTTLFYVNGLIKTITDPFDRTASFDYDANNNLSKITDMAGYYETFTYQTAADNKVYLASMANKNEEAWSFYIEPNDGINNNSNPYPAPGGTMWENYRITVTDPLLHKEEYYYYGPYSWYVSPKDYVAYVDANTNNFKLAKKTLYYLDRTDPKGRISKIESPEGGYEQYSDFDAATNQPKTVTHYHGLDASNNPILHSIFYTYNPSGMTTSVKDAKNNLTNIAYYPNNVDVQTITNGLGTITFTYNGNTHDIKTISDRLNIITEFNYDTFGKLTTVTNAKGTLIQAVTELVYDQGTHHLTDIRLNSSTLSTFTYDSIGRVKTTTDATGLTLSYDYNNLDKLTKVTFPDNKFQTFTYSTVYPNIIDSVTERSGLTTTYVHDALKRLTQVAGPSGTFSYDYDANNNLTKLIDAKMNETLFDYDSDNRMTKKTYADGKFNTYSYDKVGLLKTFTNARNIVKSYGYDNDDNLTSISYSDTTPSVSYGYDSDDRVQTRTDGAGTTGYTYYPDNRLWTVDGPLENDTITYQYNELGDLKTLTPQGGQTLTYGYDYESTDPNIKKIGRLLNIQKGTDTFSYGYTDVNPLIQTLTRPNGSATEYQYNDPLKRLTALINKKSSQEIINSFARTYYTSGPRTDLIETETITNGEAIDNFVAGTTTYEPNNLNQTASTTNPNQTFVYDDDGNMKTGFTPEGHAMTMLYDAENRMKSAEYTDSSSIVHRTEYVYAGDSLVSELKKFDGGALVSDTKYVRAGFLPIQERDGSNAIAREYAWGLNLGGGIGGLLNLKQGGNDYAYLYDGKGNVLSLIDGSQNLVANYRYDPFGVLKKKTATIDQPYMFSTKPYDEQLGFIKYEYRTLMPSIGKWATRDLMGEAGGGNLYGFVENSPVNWVDLWGLLKIKSGVRILNQGLLLKLYYLESKLPEGYELMVTEGDRSFEEYIDLYPGRTYKQYMRNKHAQHIAADIVLTKKASSKCKETLDNSDLASLARSNGFSGIGIYDKHVHVDERKVPTTWTGKSK